MNNSGKATRSAPSFIASSRARRTLSAFPATSPTVGLSWASAIFRLSAGRAFMGNEIARGLLYGNPRARLPERHICRSELALDVRQDAVALLVEIIEPVVVIEVRAEARGAVAGEQAPVAQSGADLDVAGD